MSLPSADQSPSTRAAQAAGASKGSAPTSNAIRGDKHLEDLFDRVQSLLGEGPAAVAAPNPEPKSTNESRFLPTEPVSLEDFRLTPLDVQKLVFKAVFEQGAIGERALCEEIKLPLVIVQPLLAEWKSQRYLTIKKSNESEDSMIGLTDTGSVRSQYFLKQSQYVGAAPIDWDEYCRSIRRQTIQQVRFHSDELKLAFSDLLVDQELVDQFGIAMNSGQGILLLGGVKSGKQEILERVASCFTDTIWIPRSLKINNEVIRLFDPGVHVEMAQENVGGDSKAIDQRWVCIQRPAIMAGTDLVSESLQVHVDREKNIYEAPIHWKSNCGLLIVDGFRCHSTEGQQVSEYLSSCCERRFDVQNLPNGQRVEFPFDQLLIWSVESRTEGACSESLLKRTVSKIEIADPGRDRVVELFEQAASQTGMGYERSVLEEFVASQIGVHERVFAYSSPRDLVMLSRSDCHYRSQPMQLTLETLVRAATIYFAD